MRSIKYFVLIAVVALALQSCEQRSNSMVYLHLQGGFSGDDVVIEMDGTQVYYNDSVATNNLLSLADIDSTEQANGNHEVKVIVNNGFIQTSNFNLSNTLYVGINLNPSDSTINIAYSNEPYMYE